MKKEISKGFSLIELLVVIAIIGILSSVTLATLNVARSKGADAAIKADLDTIKKQAEIYYDDNGDYGADAADCSGGMFAADATVVQALAHLGTVGGGAAVCVSDDGDPAAGDAWSWALSVPLKTDPADSWCVDYDGFVGLGTADNTTNADVAQCNP